MSYAATLSCFTAQGCFEHSPPAGSSEGRVSRKNDKGQEKGGEGESPCPSSFMRTTLTGSGGCFTRNSPFLLLATIKLFYWIRRFPTHSQYFSVKMILQWCLALRTLRLMTKSLYVNVFAIAKAIAKQCSLWGNFALQWSVPCFGNRLSQSNDFRTADRKFQNGHRVKKWPPAVFWDGFLKMAALWRIFAGRWVSSP